MILTKKEQLIHNLEVILGHLKEKNTELIDYIMLVDFGNRKIGEDESFAIHEYPGLKSFEFKIKTTSQNCQHDKCYAPFVLTTHPPKHPWICRKCLAKGTDTNRTNFDEEEYYGLEKAIKNK